VLIISIGGSALSTIRLSGTQWAISIILGAISLPVGVLIRLIPDDFLRKLIPRFHNHNQTPRIGVSSDERFEWNDALENIRKQLTFTKRIRGGRLNALMFKSQGPQELLRGSDRDSVPGTPNSQANGDAGPPRHSWARSRSNSTLGPAAAMAGVIAGSIAGWSPLERGTGDNDSIRASSSRLGSGLET
jgi:Ca2+-transporting ATPase